MKKNWYANNGDNMKRTITIGFLFTLIGCIIGTKIYKYNYTSLNEVFATNDNFYFLQEGVYANEENLTNVTKKINPKVVDYNDHKYYVYVGITKDEQIADQLIEIYKEKGLNLYKKVKPINNEEFLNNVEQFDLLIKNSKTTDEILTIEEVILANYEEIIKK